MERIKAKLKALIAPKPDATAIRIRRRKAATSTLYQRLPWLTYVPCQSVHLLELTFGCARTTLFLVGYAWMLCIPLPQLESRIYIDENALQPGQVRQFLTAGFTRPTLIMPLAGQHKMGLG